ncbi:U6 small nuclear RNA (adenine-(43)-N(6))-methyltransferase [Macrosteles quadrilineatus]|uniref:U6 small nuclear RNA (adenine-(43)-N(6))-methyltransferase n=1 Tax=Macrosteles quadrilineatus TaxID=74068 RepID=UPI0023E10AD6|nr:U6 small nuclear RNA (adenine-(43)-N(6))-methyltransferase [Macrosteles quadrilineatus]
MAMNKFMHPRNRYRRPPDFKALAIKYPEFRKYAQQDITGKVSFNFKDAEALRALTRTLLLEDFSLDVEIPLGRLIPTLPLRLNYLLWIEDILESNNRVSEVIGIDIGCGANCVYPLLAAKQFGWRMLATEVDMESVFIAGRNVKKNKLQDLITVRNVKDNQMLDGALDDDKTYDFCMCNPPFFSSAEELDPKNNARTQNRPEPRNAHTGATTELVVPGGEIAFITNIINDSVLLKAKVRVYSVMVGHKTSVGKVKQVLETAGVPSASVVTTEFCQGQTTRWGIAWTLDPAITLPHIEMKKKKPTSFSQTFKSDLNSTVERLKQLLEELQITYKFLKSTQGLYAMEIIATNNTWANSRKKRRQEKFKQKGSNGNEGETSDEKTEGNKTDSTNINGDNVNLGKESGTKTEEGKTDIAKDGKSDEMEVEEEKTESEADSTNFNGRDNANLGNKKVPKGVEEGTDIVKDEKHDKMEVDEGKVGSTEEEVVKETKRRLVENQVSSSSDSGPKKSRLENVPSGSNPVSSRKDPILYGSLVVRGKGDGSSVEVTWLKGTGGRDCAHQVLQYLKNNFDPNDVGQ